MIALDIATSIVSSVVSFYMITIYNMHAFIVM